MSIRTEFVGEGPGIELPGLGTRQVPDVAGWDEDAAPSGGDRTEPAWRPVTGPGPLGRLLPGSWPERPTVLELTAEEVDRLAAGLPGAALDRLRGGAVPADSYRFVRDGRPVDGNRLRRGTEARRMEPVAVDELTSGPGTSVFSDVQDWSPEHGRLAAGIAAEAGCPVSLSCFVSSPAVPGFPAHYDTHHAVLVQLSGSKTWLCSAAPVVDPGDEHPWPRIEHLYAPGALTQADIAVETTLSRGTALWIPPGWVHRGMAGPDASVHVTIALQPLRRYDLVMALALTADRLRSLRRMLPPRPLRPGLLAGELRDALDDLSGFVVGHTGQVDDRLAELLLSVPGADPLPGGTVHAVRRLGGTVQLHLGDRVLVADGPDAEAIGRLLDGDPVGQELLRSVRGRDGRAAGRRPE